MFYIYYHFFFHWTETAPVQEVPPPRPPLPTEATAPPPRPPLPSDEMVEVQQVLEQPPEDNRMAVCLLLTSCNDCSQFSTSALPIINLFTPLPPLSLPKRCFQCLLGVTAVPREIEGNNSNPTKSAVFAPQSLQKLLFCKCFWRDCIFPKAFKS